MLYKEVLVHHGFPTELTIILFDNKPLEQNSRNQGLAMQILTFRSFNGCVHTHCNQVIAF